MKGSVNGDKIEQKEKIWQKPLIRQLFAATVSWNTYLVSGLSIGALTVSIPQMREEGIEVTPTMASWFSSIVGYGALPWLIAPVVSQRIGLRKITMVVYLTVFVGAINIYFCHSAGHFLFGQALAASCKGVSTSISILIIIDYTSPENRGLCLTVKSATVYWGIWLANTIGTFFYWRYIHMTIVIVSLLSMLPVFILPESPFWLASKRRIGECKTSFRWLRGSNDQSEKELDAIISAEYGNDAGYTSIRKFIQDVLNPKFYKPFSIGCLLDLFYYSCGKLTCSVYAIEIFKKITATDRDAYQAMLIMDAVTIIGLYTGCFLSKKFNRRFMLFMFSGAGIVLLFSLSLYLYLVKLELIVENPMVSIGLLSLFSIAISCGPIILSTSIMAELVPYNYRATYTVLCTLFSDIIFGVTMQVAPRLFSLGLHVAFLVFGIICTLIVSVLYKVLPETKGKTLVEINDTFRNKTDLKTIENDLEANKLMT